MIEASQAGRDLPRQRSAKEIVGSDEGADEQHQPGNGQHASRGWWRFPREEQCPSQCQRRYEHVQQVKNQLRQIGLDIASAVKGRLKDRQAHEGHEEDLRLRSRGSAHEHQYRGEDQSEQHRYPHPGHREPRELQGHLASPPLALVFDADRESFPGLLDQDRIQGDIADAAQVDGTGSDQLVADPESGNLAALLWAESAHSWITLGVFRAGDEDGRLGEAALPRLADVEAENHEPHRQEAREQEPVRPTRDCHRAPPSDGPYHIQSHASHAACWAC